MHYQLDSIFWNVSERHMSRQPLDPSVYIRLKKLDTKLKLPKFGNRY